MSEKAWGWLEPALRRGRDAHLTRQQIEAGIGKGLALFVGEDAAMMLQLVRDDRGACAHVWLAGGSLSGVLAIMPGVEAWARGAGAQFASVDGRPGWARALKPHGFERAGEELVKRL